MLWRLTTSLIAVAVLSACGADTEDQATTSTSPTAATTTSTIAAPLTTPAALTKTWVDLDVGDCITDIPRVDLGEVSVTLVDCATPHRAEVFFRAGIPVNAAIDDVANQECGGQFPRYTGQSLSGGPLAMTYLIDSNQDRTVIDPTTGPSPSNVICLLEAAAGGPLTGSARR